MTKYQKIFQTSIIYSSLVKYQAYHSVQKQYHDRTESYSWTRPREWTKLSEWPYSKISLLKKKVKNSIFPQSNCKRALRNVQKYFPEKRLKFIKMGRNSLMVILKITTVFLFIKENFKKLYKTLRLFLSFNHIQYLQNTLW